MFLVDRICTVRCGGEFSLRTLLYRVMIWYVLVECFMYDTHIESRDTTQDEYCFRHTNCDVWNEYYCVGDMCRYIRCGGKTSVLCRENVTTSVTRVANSVQTLFKKQIRFMSTTFEGMRKSANVSTIFYIFYFLYFLSFIGLLLLFVTFYAVCICRFLLVKLIFPFPTDTSRDDDIHNLDVVLFT